MFSSTFVVNVKKPFFGFVVLSMPLPRPRPLPYHTRTQVFLVCSLVSASINSRSAAAFNGRLNETELTGNNVNWLDKIMKTSFSME